MHTATDQIDMEVAEVSALIAIMRSHAENVEDDEYLRLRNSAITLLYIIEEKLRRADRFIPATRHVEIEVISNEKH